MRRIETAICSSVTVTQRSTRSFAISNALLPNLRNGQTIGECRLHGNPRWFSFAQGGRKTRDVLGLDRDNLDLRSKRLHRERDSGKQSAAADRDNDGVEIRHLLDDLDAHRALARDDGGIIVAVDVGQAALLGDFVRVRFGFAEILAVHDHGRAELLAIAHFDQGRELRHHDGGGNAQEFSLIGEGLGVITRGGGDDAALLLFRRQLRERVPRAAFLEASGALEVVQLAINLHPRDLAQRNRVRARRVIHCAFDAFARDRDVLEGGQGDVKNVKALASLVAVTIQQFSDLTN